MTDWMTIRVVLSRQADAPLPHPAGRVLLVHADHSFSDLAEAIDTSFGRWDLTPLHQFEVEGRTLLSAPEDTEAEDSDEVTIGEVGLRTGARFTYLFDIGEGWTHDCSVEEVAVDPYALAGEEPDVPVPVFGWGMLPDQYGRLTEDDELPDEPLWDGDGEGAGSPPWDDAAGEPFAENDLEEWDAAETSSWEIVEAAIADVERQPDGAALAEVTAILRTQDDSEIVEALWAAADVDPESPPDDDEELWVTLAAGVVAPLEGAELDPERLAAWGALEPADWAGAVIELVREGPGARVTPEDVLAAISACPEVEENELTPEGEATMLAALAVIIDFWRTLGIVGPDDRLTPLGHWGLPESLADAWEVNEGDPGEPADA